MTGTNQSNDPTFASIPSDDELKAIQAPVMSEPAVKETPAEPAYDMPDKFKDKSIAEVIESYSNLESQLGRQTQELGNLRKFNDQLLDLRGTASDQDQYANEPELTADDVLNDPRSAIESVAASSVAGTNSRVDRLEHDLAMRDFEGRHPTYQSDMDKPEFQDFVSKSAYRQGLAQRTLKGDLQAAEELWLGYEELGSAGTPEKVDQDALDSATSIATRGGSEADVNVQKPVSRAELTRIRIEDEDRYYSAPFQKWVQSMYANKLVK